MEWFYNVEHHELSTGHDLLVTSCFFKLRFCIAFSQVHLNLLHASIKFPWKCCSLKTIMEHVPLLKVPVPNDPTYLCGCCILSKTTNSITTSYIYRKCTQLCKCYHCINYKKLIMLTLIWLLATEYKDHLYLIHAAYIIWLA